MWSLGALRQVGVRLGVLSVGWSGALVVSLAATAGSAACVLTVDPLVSGQDARYGWCQPQATPLSHSFQYYCVTGCRYEQYGSLSESDLEGLLRDDELAVRSTFYFIIQSLL